MEKYLSSLGLALLRPLTLTHTLGELTQPQILQIDNKAASEVKDCEERVAHECGALKSRERRSHKQRH